MGITADRNEGIDAPLRASRVAVVCRDPVVRVLAMRMIERLGHAPQLFAGVAEAIASAAETLLIDDRDVSDQATMELDAAVVPPRVVVMHTDGSDVALRGVLRLRKPLDRLELGAALLGTGAPAHAADIDATLWDELLRLFGRSGVAEMIDALNRDLPQQQSLLADALRDADHGAIKRIAHSLRGVALQFGASSLAGYCSQVEQAAMTDIGSDAIHSSSTQMLDRYSALIHTLEAKLHGV